LSRAEETVTVASQSSRWLPRISEVLSRIMRFSSSCKYRVRHRSSRRRVFALGALWLGISSAVLLAPGCYGRNCDGGTETFGVDAGQGRMVDDDDWESSGFDETWLWYPRQRIYNFDIPALGGRPPLLIDPYLSVSANPNMSNATPGAGNAVELLNVRPNGFGLHNNTCSDYWLRVHVHVRSLAPENRSETATGGDAGVAEGLTD
jgi:hypothetical protein